MIWQPTIESRARQEIHWAAADVVRNAGGHRVCAAEIGFLAVQEQYPEDGDDFKPDPCAACRGIWEAHKLAETKQK